MIRRFNIWIICGLWLLHPITALPQWTKGMDPEIPVPIATFKVALKGDTIFAGAYRGTLYRSTDRGSTWTEIRSGLPPDFYEAYTLLINGNMIYAGTDAGVYRSTNWGDEWTSVATGLPSPANVVTLIGVGDNLVAGTGYGVYQSSNNGETWQPDTTGLPKSSYGGDLPVSSLIVVDSFLVAGVRDGVYRRSVAGGRWTPSNAGLPLDVVYHPRVNSLLYANGRLYAATDICGASVYVSTDDGSSWSWASNGFNQNSSDCYTTVWSFGISGAAVFAGTAYGLFRSTDAGEHWRAADSGLPLGPAGDLFVTSYASSGAELFVSTFAGVFRLNAGDSVWRAVFTIVPKKVMDVAVGGSGSNLFREAEAGYWNGFIEHLYRSTNHGDSWSIDTTSKLRYFSALQSVGSNLYAVGGGISVSTDFGDHWSEADFGLPPYGIRSISGEGLHLFAGWGAYILNGDVGGVYRSTDGGVSWDTAGLMDLPVGPLAALGQTVVAVTNGLLHGYEIHRTTDGGITWSDISSLFPAGVRVGSLVTVENSILAGTNQGVYYSADGGASWIQSVAGWPRDSTGLQLGVSLLYVNSTINALQGICLASVAGLVLATHDLGITWKTVSDGLPGTAVTLLGADAQVLIAGTAEGIWRRGITEVVSAGGREGGAPFAFSLAQNYPNPFNPSTEIAFTISRPAHVRIQVFSLLGQLVQALLNEEREAGTYRIRWDAGSIPSGIYFYRITAGTEAETKKAVLIR